MLISRSVVRRKKNGRDLKGILRITRDPLAQALNNYFASIRREGQPVTDYATVLDDLENSIDVDFDKLQIADWAHLAEVSNDKKLRREREEVTTIVHRTLVNISDTVDGSHGEGTAEEYLGLGPGLRKEPELMMEAAVFRIQKEKERLYPHAELANDEEWSIAAYTTRGPAGACPTDSWSWPAPGASTGRRGCVVSAGGTSRRTRSPNRSSISFAYWRRSEGRRCRDDDDAKAAGSAAGGCAEPRDDGG